LTEQPSKSGRLRRFARLLRAWLLTIAAVMIILTAVIVGIGRALIPHADELRPWLTERLSERLGEPVRIDRVEAQWPRLTPQLSLHALAVGPPDDPLLRVDQARLEVHLANLIGSERNLLELIVLGLDLLLAEDDQGRWGLRLVGGAELYQDGLSEAVPFGDLVIRDARLRVRSAAGFGFAARLVQGEVRRRGRETLVRGRIEPAESAGSELDFAVMLGQSGGRWTSGRAWLNAQDLMIQDWLRAPGLPPATQLSLQGWADWSEGRGGRLDADLAVAGLDDSDDGLEAEIVATRQQGISQLQITRLSQFGQQPVEIARDLAVARRDRDWSIALDRVDLGAIHRWLTPWLSGLPVWPEQVSGQVRALLFNWRQDAGLTALDGRLENLAWRVPARFPSLSGLDIGLALDGDRPVLEPAGQPRLDWASMFAETIPIERVTGHVLLSPAALELRKLYVDAGFVAGQTDGWLFFEQAKPFMDLAIRADRLQQVDPRRFLPLRFIPPKADQWLRRSLTWIESASGSVLLHMQAGTRSRQIRPGHFASEISFSGLDIDYWDEWPRAAGLAGQAEFLGRSLRAEIDRASVGGLDLASASLSLPDLVEPRLDLILRSGQRPASAIADLLARLPLDIWQRSLDPMIWSGQALIETRLELPFKRIDDWWLEGEAEFLDARLQLPVAGLDLSGVAGRVGFDRQALGPARLTIDPTASGQASGSLNLMASLAEPAWLQVEGEVEPAALFGSATPLVDRLAGRTDVVVNLASHPDGGLSLDLSSSLQGLALNLPEPLSKARDERWPLDFELRLDGQEQALALSLDDWLEALGARSDQDWRLGLRLGGGEPELPAAGLRARGELARLDLLAWQQLLLDGLAPGSVASQAPAGVDVDLDLAELSIGGLRFNGVEIDLRRDLDAWRARLLGPELEGELIVPVPLDSGRVVVADLRRLALAPFEHPETPGDLAAQPLSGQTSSASPIGLPPLHVLIESLSWGALDLGRARLESHPSADGVEVELIDVSGPDLRLAGSGRWVLQEGRAQTEFAGRLVTENVDGLLASAGYQAALQSERTQLELDLRWPGAPSDFALGRLSGVLDLQVSQGSIPEASPGAGRLLGLASLTALPRRLTLDFRDVFGSGLSFDQIQGRFDLAAGFARTDALILYSPAARVTISGDTDMAARRYDQRVRVEPGLGGTLPVIGILAGGPVGAAAGLVLQSIFDRPLRGVAEVQYTVTGPWDDPLVELIQARVTDEQGEETVIGPPPPE